MQTLLMFMLDDDRASGAKGLDMAIKYKVPRGGLQTSMERISLLDML
jgi:hypothetical protein